MLLIRPLLETNRERKHVKHTVIFFIFVVCNCGGCLLPIGDPPLFLGYLLGVPFLWTLAPVAGVAVRQRRCCWRSTSSGTTSGAIRTKTAATSPATRREVRPLRFGGLWPNALLLLGVVLSVGLLDPSKPLPGTDWHPWLYLREIVQLALVGLSLAAGQPRRAPGQPASTTTRSSRWPPCSSASSSACSRRCRSCSIAGRASG